MLTFTQAELYALLNQFFWPLVRILAYLLVDPLWSLRSVPRKTKIGLALALTLVIGPLVPPFSDQALDGATLTLVLINQLLIGMSLGLMVKIMFAIVDFAGNIISSQMGLGFAAQMDPSHGQQTQVLANFFWIFNIFLYLAANAHLLTFTVVVESFKLLPITATPLSASGWYGLVLYSKHIFSLGLLLSLPILATLLLTNIAFGVTARAAPQINLFAVGFPLMLIIGLITFYLALPSIPSVLSDSYDRMITSMLDLLRSMPKTANRATL